MNAADGVEGCISLPTAVYYQAMQHACCQTLVAGWHSEGCEMSKPGRLMFLEWTSRMIELPGRIGSKEVSPFLH